MASRENLRRRRHLQPSEDVASLSDGAQERDIIISEQVAGIWKIKTAHSRLGAHELKDDVQAAPFLFWRLAWDIFNISPQLTILWLMHQLWSSVSGSISLYLGSSLLQAIEKRLSSGAAEDADALKKILLIQIFFFILGHVVPWYSQRMLERFHKMVTLHFELILMRADFDMDLATSKASYDSPEQGAEDAWRSLNYVVGIAQMGIGLLSDIAVIVNISRSAGGLAYVLLCISQPIMSHISRTKLAREYMAFTINEDYHFLRNLHSLAKREFRSDIISGDLGGWILSQYDAVQRKLQGVFIGSPETYLDQDKVFPTSTVVLGLLGDLPIIYCALSACYSPRSFSVVSMAALQQSSNRRPLRLSVRRMIQAGTNFRHSVNKINALYTEDTTTSMKTGDRQYPDSNAKASRGMSFELRNLMFSYPGTQDVKALNDISLSIKSGELIVIVGANGSGKSTLIRLLCRLYEPSSGELLIDGSLASEYRARDLRRATVLLSQDNLVYPLSFRLNIGLGYPGKENDDAMIKEAAHQGGAAEFIAKMKDGMDTNLSPGTTFKTSLYRKKWHPLFKEMISLHKTAEISGGEKQRLAAARAFMRLKTGNVNFVAVDEPSSALDADGELKLFQNLIAVREGKTMVFVTHRFGHLTRHADQIICMKDGRIVERGSHEQLIQLDGEYANLYNIQARAFTG